MLAAVLEFEDEMPENASPSFADLSDESPLSGSHLGDAVGGREAGNFWWTGASSSLAIANAGEHVLKSGRGWPWWVPKRAQLLRNGIPISRGGPALSSVTGTGHDGDVAYRGMASILS